MEVCNMCGTSLDMWDKLHGITIEKDMGYGSQYDGCHIKLHLCCKCSDNLISKSIHSMELISLQETV